MTVSLLFWGLNVPRNKLLQIRVTQSEAERLGNLAKITGHKNISEFVREHCLRSDLLMHEKLNKILSELKRNESNVQKNNV